MEIQSYNPATQELLWKGEATSHEELDRAIDNAHTAFQTWSRLSLQERIVYLEKYAHTLTDRRENLVETIAQETGKPLWESLQEIDAMIQKVAISIEAYDERCPHKTEEALHITHRPHGVVAVFGILVSGGVFEQGECGNGGCR